MNIRVPVLTALLALTVAGPANASTASVSDGTLTVSAAPGEINELHIEQRADGYFLQDGAAAPKPGAGCTEATGRYNQGGALCTGVSSIALELGDRADFVYPTGPLAAPLTFSGGAGRDLLIYQNAPAAISVSNDGIANDGPSGKDNIKPDVERLAGTEFADTLKAGPLGAVLGAGEGDDKMAGGPGNDTINAAGVEDSGLESGYFYELGKDKVTCGAGRDFVLSDHGDSVARDCEVVAVDNFGASGNGGYVVSGSKRSDRIGPLPYGWGPATVHAYAGNDTIRTAEVQRVYGGRGDDRIIGFDYPYSQEFHGGAGHDRIDVRDKTAEGHPDMVRCGPGNDIVYANKDDRIAKDCEHVSRR